MIYIGFIGLCLIAAIFVALPVFRRGRVDSATEHAATMKALYRQRLEELDGEGSAYDANLHQDLRQELGAVLLAEHDADSALTTKSQAQQSTQSTASVRWLSVGALLVPAMAMALYWQVADPFLQQIKGAEIVLSLPFETHQDEIEVWSQKLQDRVGRAANDSKSFYLLGHTHLKLGRYSQAAQAFASADQLVEGDASVQVYWLQARYLAARGVLDEVSRGLAAKLLKTNPGLPVVLEILALDAFRSGNKGVAITYLNRALSGSKNPAQIASFSTAISQIRQDFVDAPPAISIEISAQGDVPHGATIFVVARPIGGGMPYAAIRRPAVLLPLSVKLDDLVSMSDARKLSAAESFEVIVRLSLKGSVMPQTGDWQWQSPALVPGEDQSLQVVLARPVG